MTRDTRLLFLLILLMAYGLFAVEGRYRPYESTATDPRHRHRHGHESSGSRRNRHDLADRRSSWPQELDSEGDPLSDRDDDREEEEEVEEDEEDDYDYDYDYDSDYDSDARSYYERPYSRAHGRMLERRYPPRPRRGGYRGSAGHYVHYGDRRGGYSRYAERRAARVESERPRRRLDSSRNREAYYDSEEGESVRPKGRGYDGARDGRHRSWWKSGRKHRVGGRYESRPDGRAAHPSERWGRDGRFEEGRRRPNSSELGYPSSSRKDSGRTADTFEDPEYSQDDSDDSDDSDDDDDDDEEEEDVVWTGAEDDEELDNDFYRSEKPPLKTFDDIIKRLTAGDSTTVKPSTKRYYRNTEIDRLANFEYEPRNFGRPLVRDRDPRGKIHASSPAARLSGRRSWTRSSPIERKSSGTDGSVAAKSEDPGTRTRTKSLQQRYGEDTNASDGRKEEDLAKVGAEEDAGLQSDVADADYTEDEGEGGGEGGGEGEGEDEEETPGTSTASTTSTATTTTTPRPVVTQSNDYREPRAHEGGTGAQYNGYQSRNDYPPMSAHSVHKWQALGTRESVKETRSNMQQYNKNGKTAEIREALQHAIKVSREGSCQWPRPRVIPVREVYPSPSTTYIPHCAILHRCSDDTGCCRSEALTCVPKHSHRVELSFYTTNLGGGSVVEKLSFYNHTECECRERSEYETSNEKPSEQRVYRNHPSSTQPQNMRRAQPRKPCRCPSEFTPRITAAGECHCNCYENHQNCIKIRRGKGYFSLADRLCIQNEECATPSCEFGEYMKRQGKCPRKKDKFDAIANYHANLNHRYRN